MIINEMISHMEYEHVHDAILKWYPDETIRVNEGFFKELYASLRELTPLENTSFLTIHVQQEEPEGNDAERSWNVSYSKDRRYHHRHSLEFLSWEEIVSGLVREEDLLDQAAEEFLAHLLVEIASEGQMKEQEDGIRTVDPKNHLPHFSETYSA